MNPDEAEKYILDKVEVTHQKVTLAQAYILKHFDEDSQRLIDTFLTLVDAKMPTELVLHDTVDPVPAL